jgi:sugar lactone lactonase YvrE
MMKKGLISILFLAFGIFLSSCGDKTDLSQFPINGGSDPNVGEVVYVQQSPTWNQFNGPAAVYLGKEPLVYVADTKNNRVIQLDLSGSEIGSISVKNPVAISQDYNFDLLVIADTITGSDTLNVIYRLNLVETGGFISNATLRTLLTSDYPTPTSNRRRRFTGISVYPDNKLIVTRKGPDNSNVIDPDNALLKISGRNTVTNVTVLSGFQPVGNGIYSIEKTSGITTFANNQTDFILIRNTIDFGFKVEWFVFDNLKGTYEPKFIPGENIDLITVQLGTPAGITLDPNNNIFVVDNTRDSLYKFSATGELKSESFGGNGSGENQLNGPKGVSFFNRVLYIADTDNNRIVRYKLSTDIN